MARAVLIACLPWAAALAVSVLLLYLLARVGRLRPQWQRLRGLARDQGGGVQSLSFVLTLPFFVMILLFILQVSQLMIATIIVNYAAYAGARAASVWIPACCAVDSDPRSGDVLVEGPNCISTFYNLGGEAAANVPVVVPSGDPNEPGGRTYVFGLEPDTTTESIKSKKIFRAIVLACMSIGPSASDVQVADIVPGSLAQDAIDQRDDLLAIYGSMAANVPSGTLQRKLRYVAANTHVELTLYHKNAEPPLETFYVPGDYPTDIDEFRFNEFGWQDQITVKVQHDLALLPGPGRFLSRILSGPPGTNDVAEHVSTRQNVYVYPITATAVIGNEGEKSMMEYVHPPEQ